MLRAKNVNGQTDINGNANENAKEKQRSRRRKPNNNNNNQAQQPVIADAAVAQDNVKAERPRLRVIPLGGLGEVGKNMTLIEYGEDIIVVDCGSSFPNDDMPGIDLVIPDMTYLEKNAHRVRAVFITHGHEDHIGSVPYAYKFLNAPLYGTRLALAFIENKLKEHRLSHVQLNVITAGDKISAGCFNLEFIRVCHSIADSVALAIRSPVGTIVHTGDFKVDFTPIDGQSMDLSAFSRVGDRGVLLLMADSTNAERPGYTMTEKSVGDSLNQYFDQAKGRVIVASFASNIHRMQQVADISFKHGRKLCFHGRSMINNSHIARELGYLKLRDDMMVDVDKVSKYPVDELTIITTGSQGEPMSGLARMASGANSKIEVMPNDLVIISASPIPGNEKMVFNVINQLYQKGADVVYESLAAVHVSGHACKEELKLMFSLTRPKFFLPVHGEYRHLVKHAQLAEAQGIPGKNVFIADVGNVLELTRNSARLKGSVPSGNVLVDGLGIGDVGNVVLRDRKVLSKDGLLMVVLTISQQSGELMSEPDIISRGFVYVRESEALMEEAREAVKKHMQTYTKLPKAHDWSMVKAGIRNCLRALLYEKTKRNPMILPVIIEV